MTKARWAMIGLLVALVIAVFLMPSAPKSDAEPSAFAKKVRAALADAGKATPLPNGETPAPPTVVAALPEPESAARVELRLPLDSNGAPLHVPPPRVQLTDRRPNPGPNAAGEREQLGYALETLDDDVEACLSEWAKTGATEQGEVMLAIQLDRNGMQKAWAERDGGVPFGARSCLTNATWGIDWSHMVESPVEVTRRYALQPEKDAGN